jgi:hypothetical protein
MISTTASRVSCALLTWTALVSVFAADAAVFADEAYAADDERVAEADEGAADESAKPAPAPPPRAAAEAPRANAAPPARPLDRRLARGQVLSRSRKVKGFGVPRFIVQALVNAPPAKVWERLSDCRRLSKILMNVEQLQVLRETKRTQRCRMVFGTPFPYSDITSELDYTRASRDGGFKLSFSLHKGDYLRNRGSWTLTPVGPTGQQTLVRYDLHTVPDLAAPDSMVTWGTRRALTKMMVKLQKLFP